MVRLATLAALALLLLVLLPFPASTAQPADGAVRVLSDPPGDLSVEDGPKAPVPRGATDLQFLDILEGLDNLTLTVGVSPDPGGSDQGQVDIRFRQNDAEFRLHLEQRNLVNGWWWMFVLYRIEADGESFVSIGESLKRDREAGTVTLVLEKKDLADRQGVIPFVGRQLSDFWATSSAWLTPVPLTDRMPDAGIGEAFTFAKGEGHQGPIELWSPSPARASNGEATTVVYTVAARNTGSQPQQFIFGAQEVPPGWQVVFPQPLPTLAPGEVAEFPVLVGLPFRHEHGKMERVLITLTDLDDEGTQGRLRLAVNYHAIPQPAGHHPVVYFHSATLGDDLTPLFQSVGAVWDRVFMNTVEEFQGDHRLSVPGAWEDTGTWTWESPLNPVLQMGLDFDLARTGEVALPFSAPTEITGATLAGTLDLQWQAEADGDWQVLPLADLLPGPAVTLPRDQVTTMTATLVPRPEADLVPYREGANLVLRPVVTGKPTGDGSFGPEKPWLEPGGQMTLPLLEYSDPVDGLFRSLQGVELTVDGAAQRLANPGETVRFPLRLAFSRAAEFEVTFAGAGAASAQVVGGPNVLATPDGAPLEVAVTLPADAAEGSVLDVLVIAQLAGDGNVQGIARIVPEADLEADHADQPYEAPVADTPLLPAALVALALLAAASLRRRD